MLGANTVRPRHRISASFAALTASASGLLDVPLVQSGRPMGTPSRRKVMPLSSGFYSWRGRPARPGQRSAQLVNDGGAALRR